MSAAVAIIDPYCLAPYTLALLEAGALSGTEAIIMRVMRAHGNAFRFHVYQMGRFDIDHDPCGFYRPINSMKAADLQGISAIVVINSWKSALKARRLNPDCPIFLRLHANPGRHNRRMGDALAAANVEIICASHAHARHVTEFLRGENAVLPVISTIHNPVDDGLRPDDTPRERNRLFFPGAPLRGMSEALSGFASLRAQRPELELDIAESADLALPPGPLPAGVTFLGRLGHAATIDRMRRSLCLFHPRTGFHEPFPLPLAEANAVGTPVLADAATDINREILGDFGQCIDTGDMAAIAARIDQWRAAMPEIRLPDPFRLSNIVAQWQEKLTIRQDRRQDAGNAG